MKISLSVSLLTILLAGQVFATPPGAAESEYLVTTGGGFLLAKGAPIYAMNFKIIKELPDGYRLEFQFQNPEQSEQPLTKTPVLNIDGDSITVQSPPLDCIRNGERYLVRVKIYADETETVPIATHEQEIEFAFPASMIEQLGVQLCR